MLNEIFKQKTPFIYEYFSSLLELVNKNERKFPQAIIFEGSDTILQYLFTMELAKALNCIGSKTQNCDCINCKWIKNFSHPCVNNVSQIHFTSSDDKSKDKETNKTRIKVGQAKEIELSLSISSDYYRFYVFFSSKEHSYTNDELTLFKMLGYTTNIDYSIEPLDSKTFPAATADKLLKIVEEPPKNTTFIFLTNSRANIIPTIVSRCQTFILNQAKPQINYSDIVNLTGNYPVSNYIDAITTSENLQKYIKDSSVSCVDILIKFQVYLKEILKQNTNNVLYCKKLKNDINIINDAIKQKKATMSDKNVLDTLFLRLTRGY